MVRAGGFRRPGAPDVCTAPWLVVPAYPKPGADALGLRQRQGDAHWMSSATVGRSRSVHSGPQGRTAARRIEAMEARGGWVPRDRLVRRLMSARDTPLVLVVAPAGYGKTTL